MSVVKPTPDYEPTTWVPTPTPSPVAKRQAKPRPKSVNWPMECLHILGYVVAMLVLLPLSPFLIVLSPLIVLIVIVVLIVKACTGSRPSVQVIHHYHQSETQSR